MQFLHFRILEYVKVYIIIIIILSITYYTQIHLTFSSVNVHIYNILLKITSL